MLFPWNTRLERAHVDLAADPTPARPLVYHLFGRLDKRDSLVITEDDYFDYLIGWTRNREMIPEEVRSALVNSSLLFMGFQMDDWSFRAFYRSIISQGGSPLHDRNIHVAVQVDPEETRMADPTAARKYVQNYFQGQKIRVYWGRVSDFIRDLRSRWNERCENDPDWQDVQRIA